MNARKRKRAAPRLTGDDEGCDGAENGNDGDIGEQPFAATAAQRATPLGVEPFLQGFKSRLSQSSTASSLFLFETLKEKKGCSQKQS